MPLHYRGGYCCHLGRLRAPGQFPRRAPGLGRVRRHAPRHAVVVERLTRTFRRTDTGEDAIPQNPCKFEDYWRWKRGTTLALEQGRRWWMDILVELSAAVAGLAVGVGAARMVLEGILTATFGRRI